MDCDMTGPNNDPDGAKWNSLPRVGGETPSPAWFESCRKPDPRITALEAERDRLAATLDEIRNGIFGDRAEANRHESLPNCVRQVVAQRNEARQDRDRLAEDRQAWGIPLAQGVATGQRPA
jgi:hypothetical protein